jgi:acyl-coenzyme A synthetase/AMP-(fatty) acid ligase
MTDRLAHRYFRLGQSVAFQTAGRDYSADDVLGSAMALAACMPDRGHAINLCEDRLHFAIGFVAAIIKRHVSLLPQNRKPVTLDALDRRYPGCYCLVDPGASGHPGLPCVQVVASAMGAPLNLDVPVPDEDQLCALVFTSGSTGEPKANRKYWKTLVQGTFLNADYLWSRVGMPAWILATVPPQHNYGLETTILAPLFLPLAARSHTGFFPADIVSELEAMPRPRVLVSTPIHLRALISSTLKLPQVDLVLSATAPLDPALAREFETACGGVLREIYGCTEAGCFAWREPAHESRWTLFDEFSLTVDPENTCLRAPHLPEAVLLQDKIDMDADGRFYLSGRLSDLVNIAGKRASLADLNLKLLSIPGVKDGLILQAPQQGRAEVERLTGLVVTDLALPELHREMERLIDPVFIPRPLLRVPQITRGPAGKVDRATVDRLLQEARRGKEPDRARDD